jgi:hypothetical protein
MKANVGIRMTLDGHRSPRDDVVGVCFGIDSFHGLYLGSIDAILGHHSHFLTRSGRREPEVVDWIRKDHKGYAKNIYFRNRALAYTRD